jgi:hypothetical protein
VKILDLPDEHPSLFVTQDPDQFAKDLKDLDPMGWDPLPCIYREILIEFPARLESGTISKLTIIVLPRWAWTQINQAGNGKVSKKDLYRLSKKFMIYVQSNANICGLIQTYNKKRNGVLDQVFLDH